MARRDHPKRAQRGARAVSQAVRGEGGILRIHPHTASRPQTRISPDTGKEERVSTALLFERLVFLPVGSSPAFHQPLQVAYCGKVKNGGKLSSHQVFFDGFCRAIQPDYVFLVDVGTRPSPMSIVRLYTAMEADESVGGCCGDIAGAAACGVGRG